ncbi:hypothetical protein AMJ40_00990 [candidate division TA06 bacterium DG_26]|uniref:PTS EIIA type-2 domain-containing protein n=1 Tax=candidate division TA06 bacterium DG_26 TaxID=1703771 RepID=A0A0S7WLU0_UNCT6|nr:MAG: hypothetical protein AMJ40_00990 [candidate division TA06 bacterium DG_26]
MRLSELLDEDRVILSLQGETKDKAIEELLHLLVSSDDVEDRRQFVNSVRQREAIESTGIGNGIAIPHGITDAVRRVVCAMGMSEPGIDFGSIDGKPVHLLFLLGVPKSEAREYLNLLSRIGRLFRKEELTRELMRMKSIDKVLATLREREKTLG